MLGLKEVESQQGQQGCDLRPGPPAGSLGFPVLAWGERALPHRLAPRSMFPKGQMLPPPC